MADPIADTIRADAKAQLQQKVLQARRMSAHERFFTGVELFDYACEISLAGLKQRFPEMLPSETRARLGQMIKLKEQLAV